MIFFGASNSLFGKVSPIIICKNSCLNSPDFFSMELSFLKICKICLGRRMQRYIQNPVEYLRWNLLGKWLIAFNCKLNLQKAPF